MIKSYVQGDLGNAQSGPVVLSQGWFCPPQGTFHHVWRQFWLPQLGTGKGYWSLVAWGQDPALYPTTHSTVPTTSIQPQMSIVPGWKIQFQIRRIASKRGNSKKLAEIKKKAEDLSLFISSCCTDAPMLPQNSVAYNCKHVISFCCSEVFQDGSASGTTYLGLAPSCRVGSNQLHSFLHCPWASSYLGHILLLADHRDMITHKRLHQSTQ